MKGFNMRIILVSLIAMILLSGCVGIISGHEYTKKDMVIVYKVVKKGVITFMTPEQIAQAKLDKMDIVVTDTYKLVKPSNVVGATTSTASTK